MRRALLMAIVVGLGVALLAPVAGADERPRLAVIVHPSRQATLSADVLAQIYLRRKRFWDDGSAIVPLNLTAGASVRTVFTDAVLRMPEPRLAEYWNRQYFYGLLPPATLASTAAVVRYVAADRNAVGYVPVGDVDGSVRVAFELQ